MHEFSLYGTVASKDHGRIRQQLAGVTRMQPQEVEEIHLIFKAKLPTGLSSLPSAGGSQGVMQQESQRVKNMLNASLYYVQLVGELSTELSNMGKHNAMDSTATQQSDMGSGQTNSVKWSLEFRDTPDAGKQAVNSRLVSKIAMSGGNPAVFMEQFGYEYVSRYFVQGSKFYDQETTLFLHQILHLPEASSAREAVDVTTFSADTQLQPIDPGHQYILQASLNVVDGNHPELKDRATKQLLAMKQVLKQAVDITPGDRLALDTKLPIARRV